MCGIAGVVGSHDRTLVERMVSVIGHRGPDGRGYAGEGDCHFGVARLSILDPSAPCEPLSDATGKIRIAFNGEIYNHVELRHYLIGRGHVFTTRTDTEVVVHLYEDMGEDCVRSLRGMFAFAIFDGDKVFLARDRLGIKPLYLASTASGGLVFASEIKAILQCHEIEASLDLATFADAAVLGHPTGTQTYLTGVKCLAAGHTLSCSREGARVRVGPQVRYFEPRVHRDEAMGLEEAEQLVAAVLEDAITRHLAADVDVGLALSGGLDSTMIALLAQHKPLHTFSLADDADHPDLAEAGRVAAAIGATHHPHVATWNEFLAAIPGFVAASEQPTSLYGMPFYLLSQQVGLEVKACLCGEGADELFGGYREYLDRETRARAMARRLPLLERLGVAPSYAVAELTQRLTSPVTFDEYLSMVFDINLGDPLERLHLDGVDKSAMSAGVEMRVPYLDDEVYSAVRRVPLRHLVRTDIGVRKYVLRRLCLRRFGPDVYDTVLREKLGVPSSGIRLLMRFDDLCKELLPPGYRENHELGFAFPSTRHLLMFELFEEMFVTHRGEKGAVANVVDFMAERSDVAVSAVGR